MNESTPSQLQAIAAEGDVLVVAAAGAGKTRTLVERCLKRVLRADDPVSLDEVLMVTFTEAAAAEMRQRIRTELERRQAAAPDDAHLAEQLALLDTAAISTLHSFCLKLVREHFYDLQLDPQLTVLDDAQSRALAGETLDRVLQRHYAGTSPADEAVRELILTQGGGWDGPIRELVRRVHTYSQTLADPQGWRRAQLAAFEPGGAAVWEQWLIEGIAAWRYDWLEALQAVDPKNPNAQQCVKALRELPVPRTPEQIGELLARILAVDVEWPKGLKTKLRAPLAKLFDEAQFLQSVTRRAPDAGDPLAEDWEWVRPHMKALVELAGEFADEFAAAKREAGGVDFHDLEQFALQLLWDRERDQPTPVALRWRERLRLVFVDEYQDINAAQDCIITAISRDGAGANRFLVGDVKQSIYRFRLANPRIILGHDHDWRDGRSRAQVISLSENFRSHEAILQFINPVFEALLRPEIGGVDYPDEARLRFGAPALRRELSLATDASPRVELHLRLTSKEDADDNGADGESLLADLGSAEREARLVAQRLHELHTQRINVWKDQHWQPVEWRDMVVLLRSPRGKAECYAREFARLGVPLEVARGGFYDTTEVTDLLSLLQLLDNPLQDVPALAVLRSPLAGLTLDELGVVRLAERRGRFWIALLKFHRDATRLKLNFSDPAIHAAVDSARPKVDAFLKSFARWRQLARQGALSHCLETVLDETHYEDWLLAQPRGAQRRANVGRLLAMTRQFDPYQRQGLFRFLNFVAAQEEMGVETGPAPAESGDAVRLMSIHQSKGLEFPIVVLANLGGRFNFEDLKANVILDDHYGLCPQVKAPVSEQRYVSLPYWLAARRQRRETLGEELRLLYVALTRACDRLILTGTATRKRAEDRWAGATIERLGTREITGANCFLDWLGPLLPRLAGAANWATANSAQHGPLSWRLWTDADLETGPTSSPAATLLAPDEAHAIPAMVERLAWQYAWPAATTEPGKTSVSLMRRRLAEELVEEAPPLFASTARHAKSTARPAAGGLSAAEVGTAHHLFLQFLAWDQLENEATLHAEASRLVEAGALSREEAGTLDFAALAKFWSSERGRLLRAQPHNLIHRELPFTARFSPADLAELSPTIPAKLPPEEFVVVQGVADLAVILPSEIWLLDFKTDHFAAAELDAKRAEHGPQLRLYAAALSRIYGRPVTRRWLHFLALNRTCDV